jgi:hypothetical protein
LSISLGAHSVGNLGSGTSAARDHAIDILLRKETAAHDDSRDPAGVDDIRDRVRVQQHQVGAPARGDGALRLFASEQSGRIDRGRLNGLQRRPARR